MTRKPIPVPVALGMFARLIAEAKALAEIERRRKANGQQTSQAA